MKDARLPPPRRRRFGEPPKLAGLPASGGGKGSRSFSEWVVRLLLPAAVREIVSGDLEEIWRQGRITRLRWWRLVAASLITSWVAALRGLPPDEIPSPDQPGKARF